MMRIWPLICNEVFLQEKTKKQKTNKTKQKKNFAGVKVLVTYSA